jgi:hypothetical protein
MSNHLDIAIQAANFQLSTDHGLGFTLPGKRVDSGASASAQKPAVKAGFAHYPVEHGGDITGRWRPVWSDSDADQSV